MNRFDFRIVIDIRIYHFNKGELLDNKIYSLYIIAKAFENQSRIISMTLSINVRSVQTLE